MNGDDFMSIITLIVSITNQVFTMMDGLQIVSTTPPLTLYGLSIFVTFVYMTADFIREMRSG